MVDIEFETGPSGLMIAIKVVQIRSNLNNPEVLDITYGDCPIYRGT